MPRKLRYAIVGATGEAEGYPARNLEDHSPTVSGWQTQRFCVYPQEVIVQLKEASKIKKLQILAHQYLIPSKVEFYIGDIGNVYGFKRLGYIYLSSNEKTGYKSRELKSVHVDTVGTMLKLVLHRNHLNKLNLYNQVSLMALNIIGDPMSGVNSIHNALNDDSSSKNPNYISPMDDLAFDLYQDPEVAQIIRRLDSRKLECVEQENFDDAKKLKQAIADLRKVGEKLAKYELEKRKAVEQENYDIAKMKKTQMEEYRLKVYQQLLNYGLVNEAGINDYLTRSPSPRGPQIPSFQSTFDDPNYHQESIPSNEGMSSPIMSQQFAENSNEKEITASTSSQDHQMCEEPDNIKNNTPFRESPLSAKENNRKLYDDKVVPAICKATPEVKNLTSSSIDEDFKGLDRGGPEPMSEKAIREASSAIEVLGLSLVQSAYSKAYVYREDALLAMGRKLQEVPMDASKEDLKAYLRAALFILKRCLVRDNVYSVFNSALNILDYLLTQFIPNHHLSRADLIYTINQTLSKLIFKTGESQFRARQRALEYIVEISSYPNVKATHLVSQAATQPFPKDMATKLAQSRVEIVIRLLDVLGLDSPAFSADAVMLFCIPALEHIAGSVRDTTCQLIYRIYRLDKDSVKKYLPPDEPLTRKNLLYRNIFDELDRIDGKPTKSELKAKKDREAKNAEKKKEQEIQELQAQVQFLRQSNAKFLQPPEKGPGRQLQTTSYIHQIDQPQAGQQNDPLERICIFCGEHDENFDEEGLDLHYWKHCPMLKRCEHCKQVVEISTYHEHLISECDKKAEFRQCGRCQEAIPLGNFVKHEAEGTCELNDLDKNAKCPLCHMNIPHGEESWKIHLMSQGKNACSENSRRIPYFSRIKAKAPTSNQRIKKIPNGR